MALYDWGDVRIGRTLYRETWTVSEAAGRTLDLQGQESTPPNPRATVVNQHDNLLALEPDLVLPVTFTSKPERNCYATVTKATAVMDDWNGDAGRVTSAWSASFDRYGSANELDLQSRLTGTRRANDWSALGELTHCPPPGHYAYYTGATAPSKMTRTGEDGALTVYRGLTAGVSPKWGCDPALYPVGRCRVEDTSGAAVLELEGTDRTVPATSWRIGNGLLRVTGGTTGTLAVSVFSAGAWHVANWAVSVAGTALPSAPGAATIVHNTMEYTVLRLTWALTPVGRATLDIGIRRGFRGLELYLQTGVAATLAVTRVTAQTGAQTSGYVTGTANDSNGDRYVIGSARTFTPNLSGGLSKAAVTAIDVLLGMVVGGSAAVSGDTAADVFAQYIGALPEAVYAVRR